MKRLSNEIFKDYKERRWNNNKRIKETLKGKLFWDSYNKGTYIKGV